jgi:hypothetical protein
MRSCIILCIVFLAVALFAANRHVEPVAGGRPDADGKTVWYDALTIGIEGRGWQEFGQGMDYRRLPASAQAKAPTAVWNLSSQSAGLCVRFTTDAPTLQVHWELGSGGLAMPHMPATGVSGVDLYMKYPDGAWRFLGNGRPVDVKNTAPFAGMVKDAELLLYLPLYNGVTKLEIGIPAGKTLSRVAWDGVKPVLIYGTSITQGGCCSRPGMAATAITGRLLDVPVVNLGFSGSGRMEPAMAELLGEVDASTYMIDCMWNMTPAMVAERVVPFVKKLRALRPTTPIVLVEGSTYTDSVPTGNGKVLREQFDALQRDGVPGLTFLSAKGMIGSDGEGTVDSCHLNDLGMLRQAQVFALTLGPLVKGK